MNRIIALAALALLGGIFLEARASRKIRQARKKPSMLDLARLWHEAEESDIQRVVNHVIPVFGDRGDASGTAVSYTDLIADRVSRHCGKSPCAFRQ